MADTNDEKVTIVDIARRANVSPSTVSRVLRGTTGVSDEKEAAVREAVAALNYRPNIFAQSLASGQSMTIGVLTQNFGSPFYDAIMLGILQGLEKTEYTPLFADGRWQTDTEHRALRSLLDRRVDGLVMLGGQFAESELLQIRQRTPLIVVGRKLKHLPETCITVDNFTASYRATRYLIDIGHRDIAHITAPMAYMEAVDDVSERYRGYQQALADAGIMPDPALVVQGNLRRQSGMLAVDTLLQRGVPLSAIFAANDQMAFGVRYGLYRRGIRVPEDISLVGFDDEPPAAYMIPPLTTVRQPANELGLTAAKAILDLIAGQSVKPTTFEARLIIRDSAQSPR